MSRRGLLAVGPADDADYAQAAPARSFGHLDNHFSNAARRDHDHDVMGPESEIPQDLFGVAGRLFQVKALAKSVGAHNGIMVSQAQLHDGMPTDKATLARRHLFAHHSTMAAAEEVYQAVSRNGFRAQDGRSIQSLALTRQEPLQSLQSLQKKPLRGRNQ